MIVSIEEKARPCPGVERAVSMAEDVLRRGEPLYIIGQLIHNRREVEHLKELGLQKIQPKSLDEYSKDGKLEGAGFLIRSHGEMASTIQVVQNCKMKIVDATCPIVHHSQELVDQHVREGWGIIIAGSKDHAEVRGLIDRTKGSGIVVSSKEEAKVLDKENRSLLIAQTTIDPLLFAEIRKILSSRFSGLKIVDTTCRFLQNRQTDIKRFAAEQELVILVGGKNSSNCRLLYNTAQKVNERAYWVEGPDDIDIKWFKDVKKIGITGCASTPHWQLDELRSFIENHTKDKYPKGLKNRKGGTFLWWMRKNNPMN
jgi:4-hydroxy-3-methylbut-2-enyl diphosphate reductase